MTETLDRRHDSLDRPTGSRARSWTLTVLWNRRQPTQGERAAVVTRSVLGRAGGTGIRLDWRKGDRAGSGVTSPYLSRQQLELVPLATGLQVRNLGRLAMRVNGTKARSSLLVAGDLLELDGELVLLLQRRGPPVSTGTFGQPDAHGLVGEGAALAALRERILALRQVGGHVLITGPSGTGKEHVARALHQGGRFVSCNAAAVPEGLAEAEWFGNIRNYPNPGMPAREGFALRAHRGSLFVDEIGELPHRIQAQLLRLLDDGEVQQLGADAPRRVELRLIAATNRPSSALKHDLHARFPHQVATPALQDHLEDLGLLVAHLLATPGLDRFLRDGIPRVTPALWLALVQRPWAGHVRELLQVLWHAANTAERDWLDGAPAVVRRTVLTPETVQDALREAQGVKVHAAESLGVSRHQLARWMAKNPV